MGQQFSEIRTKVRYKETDQMGIAHHSNYLVWFEIGRTDLCALAGMTYLEIEQRGLIMVVTAVECRYRIPYRYDDEVVIRTRITDRGSRSMEFGYELVDRSGEVEHASGKTRHLWLDQASRRPVIPPPEILRAFEPFFPDWTRAGPV